MAKLTKQQSKAHRDAVTLLEKNVLTLDEKMFVFENWQEGAEHDNGIAGAFFTPLDYANDFKLEVCGPKILDLCAGIGVLAFAWFHFRHHDTPPQITCFEVNPAYVAIGKKLLPEATWICADVFDVWRDLPCDFDTVISNPPFGRLMTDRKAPRYTGPEFELKIVDIAAHLGTFGAFILPQASTGFRYSGAQYYERTDSPKAAKFLADTGLQFEAGCGIDTTVLQDQWKQVNVITEIACIEFPDHAPALQPDPSPLPAATEQLSLFAAEEV
ncbi:hypothetical protein AWB68_07485 [Caballeronia choica]|uniref:Methyltransferase small domain-containing protein n=1 Tax=Caballeronia choica TaxID=326476 RepID=A0A158KW07_9BURK|nr:methyltransferase [Caballeronia choica]SAL84899.1 hypothetical protein AWB68_07485 [Caballeronia choica]